MKKNYLKGFLLIILLCAFSTSMAQTESQREQITSRYDKEKISQLKNQFEQKKSLEKQEAIRMAQQNGWQIRRPNQDGSFDELIRVSENGSPIYYSIQNVNAARSTRANTLNSGGVLGLSVDGQNMTVHVWDGGPTRPTHQEFDGAGGNNRVSIIDGVTSLNGNSFHAMHVTGTLVASGVQANAKGMAWQADARTSDWNNDLSEATTAAGSGMLVSNHSYGFRADLIPDQYFGAYIGESRDWDALMYNAPNYLMVVAAGNDGNDNSSNAAPLDGNSSYDKLNGHGTSKNNLVVANGQDANVDANGNLISVNINSGSSEGPTDDYRIKPDITGNGTSLYSTYDNSDSAYNTISGTSMASPNVAGTLVLLQQHYNDVNSTFMRSATLKGLALHTADDAGPNGPDAVYGWGLLNAKRAAETISSNGNESIVDELTLSPGQTYQINVDSDGVSDLMASISWTDPAGTATSATNSNTPVLVNDLDIRISQGATTYNPWRLTGVNSNGLGDNNVDPFERAEVANASGSYTITVTHKGTLSGGSQNYTLIVTGLSSTPVVCNATVPTGLSIDGFGDTTANVSWDAVPGASYSVRYREVGTSTWTTNAVSGTSTVLNGLSPLTQYEVQVRSECPDTSTSAYSSSATFTTLDVQLNYCSSASTNINDEYIGRVQLNTIDNTSGGQFYTDFTNISTTLTKGTQYSITVTPTWTGTIYAEGYSVWIDYNRDGDFTDPGEQVWTQAATTATPVSGNFTVPAGAVENSTRMRVSMKYNGVPTSCETFTYGEVEDYSVVIQGSGPDLTPPVITLIGASTINLNLGDTYTEQGATATDNVDGDISANIVIGGDTVDTNTAGTYIVTYDVSDAAGNAASQVTRTVTVAPDTTPPVITLIGASTINLNVGDSYTDPGATASDNIDGDISANIVVGGDTVNTSVAGTYVVTYNVSDAAGNAATQVIRTVNVTEPSSGCSGGISSYPYSESFENTLGAWTQSSADDIDWTVDSGGTPSSGTGPSSGSAGSYYIYVEASGNGTGYPNKQAILNSPCFDLGGLSTPSFDFDYHMNGSTDMGTIDLEVSTDEGANWTSLWNQSGNQGNSWLSASIDLSAYAGSAIQLRFNRVTGGTWQADIAIDNIKLSEPAPPTCSDGEQNGDETGVDCGGSFCPPCSSGSEIIHQGFFETGWDGWTDGGSDCARVSSANSFEGSYSIRIRDNSGTASAMTLSNVDVSTYDQLEIEFYFYPNSMETGEDFWVRYYNGSTWTTVAAYSSGTSFTNGSFYVATVTLDAAQYNFATNSGFRFQCDASANADQIFIDQVTITGINGGTQSDDSITSVGGGFFTNSDALSASEDDFMLYPNPVKGKILNVKLLDNANASFRILNMLGQTVRSGMISDDQVNVEGLESGMYFIEVNDGEEVMTKRFIRL